MRDANRCVAGVEAIHFPTSRSTSANICSSRSDDAVSFHQDYIG